MVMIQALLAGHDVSMPSLEYTRHYGQYVRVMYLSDLQFQIMVNHKGGKRLNLLGLVLCIL
jgi:hypothetical protein